MTVKTDQPTNHKVNIAVKHLLCFLTIFLLTFSLCEAATISPELQSVLQTVTPAQEVPIIINLADKVDVKHIPMVPADHTRAGRTIRRNTIVAALKDKADKTQGPIKTLLQGRGGKKMKPLWITNSIAVTVPASVINELAGQPQIASIGLDAVIQAPLITPSIAVTPRWNIDRVNAPALWDAGITGEGIVVASLDTGVDVNHPDLRYRWRGGACGTPPYCPSWYDPFNNTTVPYGIPAIPPTTPEQAALNNTHVHGTHVTGIIVGGSASGNAIGVAPGAKWISAKIFDDAGNPAQDSDIISALGWALCPGCDPADIGCVCAPSPDVVNNSWLVDTSQNACDSIFYPAISNLQAAGIEVIFSAGNVNPSPAASPSSFSPANYPGVFAVGATIGSNTDFSNTIAPFSAWGPSACIGVSGIPDRTTNFPNIVAPGAWQINSSVPVGSIFSGNTVSQYANYAGTSQSAPHVSGAAALLAGALPTLTTAQIEEALEQSASPLLGTTPNDTSPNNIYGYGLLNVAAAYQYAFTYIVNGGTPQPKIAGLDQALYFINTSTSSDLTFIIVNQGTAPLDISNIAIAGLNPGDFAIPADSCTNQSIASLGNCSVTIRFSPGAAGSRSALLSFTSNDPSVLTTFDVSLRGNDPVALVQGTTILATYADISTALADCSNWQDIRMQVTTLVNPLTSPDINLPLGITINFLGGFDPAFGTQTDFTYIQGQLTISKGTVIVGNIIII